VWSIWLCVSHPRFSCVSSGDTMHEIGSTYAGQRVAQLAIAPIAVALERRVDARLLTGVGVALFARGLGSEHIEPRDQTSANVLAAIIRGACNHVLLLPATVWHWGGCPNRNA